MEKPKYARGEKVIIFNPIDSRGEYKKGDVFTVEGFDWYDGDNMFIYTLKGCSGWVMEVELAPNPT